MVRAYQEFSTVLVLIWFLFGSSLCSRSAEFFHHVCEKQILEKSIHRVLRALLTVTINLISRLLHGESIFEVLITSLNFLILDHRKSVV